MTPPPGEIRVVDDRVFLLGLDQRYREAMKRHERGELLTCARRVAATLGVSPADVPIEGYYDEDEDLAEYTRYRDDAGEITISDEGRRP